MENHTHREPRSKATMGVVKALNWVYQKAVDGVGASSSVEQIAESYARNMSIDVAIDALIRWQAAKAGIVGFVTGLGGLVTLPAALPANFASVAYIQFRMIACIAHLRGYDIRSDQVKTMAFACLCGTQLTNVLKEAGVQVAEKMSYNLIMKSISREMLTNINRMVGFRLITKFGKTGVVKVVRIVPFFGGTVNGSVDAVVTYTIGHTANRCFSSGAK